MSEQPSTASTTQDRLKNVAFVATWWIAQTLLCIHTPPPVMRDYTASAGDHPAAVWFLGFYGALPMWVYFGAPLVFAYFVASAAVRIGRSMGWLQNDPTPDRDSPGARCRPNPTPADPSVRTAPNGPIRPNC